MLPFRIHPWQLFVLHWAQYLSGAVVTGHTLNLCLYPQIGQEHKAVSVGTGSSVPCAGPSAACRDSGQAGSPESLLMAELL